jgi:NNP family nitrate/nitrite transporter-like MFS transporter
VTVDRARLPRDVVALNTACFTLSFAAWVALGPAVRVIAAELELSEAVASLVRTLPVLVGSIVRVPVGIVSDRLGARGVFPALMLVAAAGAVLVAHAQGAASILAGAAVLGVAGTTFTVGAQAIISETAPERQGLAIGIFGAGNVGTAITTLAMPLLVGGVGWRAGLDGYALALVAGAAVYAVLARSHPPADLSLRTLLEPFAHLRVWRIGLYYTASFGVFVAATLVLVDLYVDAHAVRLEVAGLLATTFTVSTSLVRIAGGWLSDRFGARRVLASTLAITACALAPAAFSPGLEATVLLVLVAGFGMGAGMTAALREVAVHFPHSAGAVTGVVGALGGLGGFVLPNLGAVCVGALGTPAAVVLPLAIVAAVGLVVLLADRSSAAPGEAGSAMLAPR